MFISGCRGVTVSREVAILGWGWVFGRMVVGRDEGAKEGLAGDYGGLTRRGRGEHEVVLGLGIWVLVFVFLYLVLFLNKFLFIKFF